MKVGETSPLQTATDIRRAAKKGTADGPDFGALLDAASAESAGAPAAMESTAPAGGLLAFQEISDEEVRRHKEVRRGNDMVDSLERLRTSLLAGAIPPEVMRELESRLARQRELVSDPQLAALMDDIELRVAVELAKLEKERDVRESGDQGLIS